MEPAANRRTLLATAPKVPYVGVADEVKTQVQDLNDYLTSGAHTIGSH